MNATFTYLSASITLSPKQALQLEVKLNKTDKCREWKNHMFMMYLMRNLDGSMKIYKFKFNYKKFLFMLYYINNVSKY